MSKFEKFIKLFLNFLVFVVVPFAFSTEAYPNAQLSDRPVILVRGGLGEIIGTYLFAVNVVQQTPEAQPEKMLVKLLLPKEVSDFAPAEGIKPDDIKLGDDGGIYVEKEFNPGFNLVAVNFLIKASGSQVQMTLTPSTRLSELRIFAQTKELNFKSDDFVAMPPEELEGLEGVQVFSGVRNNQPLEPGKVYFVKVAGLAEGRAWFWLTGSIVAALLIGVSVFMFFRTREKYEEVGILA